MVAERHPASGAEGMFYLTCIRQAHQYLSPYFGKVRMVYIDPPIPGERPTAQVKKGTEKLRLPLPAVSSQREAYLDMIREALQLAKNLLSADGSLYLHTSTLYPQVRLLADEIFGEKNLRNEIIWHYRTTGGARDRFSQRHDTVLFYGKSKKPFFDRTSAASPRGKAPRGHLKRHIDEEGNVYYTASSGGKLYVYREEDPAYLDDVWSDLNFYPGEYMGFDGQKPVNLLKRMLLSSTRRGDIAADLFAGSGTLARAAADLGRGWLAVDVSPLSMNAHRRRLAGTAFTLHAPAPQPQDAAQVRPLLVDWEALPAEPQKWEWTAIATPVEDGYVIRTENGGEAPLLYDNDTPAVFLAAAHDGSMTVQQL